MSVINYPHICYCVLLHVHVIHILYGIIKQIVHETIILLLFIGYVNDNRSALLILMIYYISIIIVLLYCNCTEQS